MTKHILKADSRKVIRRKVKQLRAQGIIPANVFGNGLKSENIQINAQDFKKVYAEVGESTLVYLQGVGADKPAMIHSVIIHPVSGQTLHIEFHQVNLKEKITAPVKIHIVGEAPAVAEGRGILVQQTHELEVEALPTDMPEHLDVDVTTLVDVDMAIMVKDLKIDAKLKIETDPETILAKIEPLAKEEVVEAPVATAEAPVAEAATPENSDQPSEAAEPKK